MSVYVASVAPAGAPPVARRALATSISFIVIYGVTFAFFAPPATALARSGGGGFDSTSSSFALLLIAALTLTFGATIFGYAVGWRVQADMRRRGVSTARAVYEFAMLGAILSLATAGLYLALMSMSAPLTVSQLGAAALALVVPGMAAALFTLPVVDHVAAKNREMIATSLSALVVIVLTNYLIASSLPSLADLPRLMGF